jgi:diketogulonate reductase-like aldo/keto reductase
VIPKTGQQVTKLGFGSYRASNETHARALTAALEGGINIIDTGNNFENGMYLYIKINQNNKARLLKKKVYLIKAVLKG